MKKILVIPFLILGTMCMQAQNKNVSKETETKTTTVKTSEGEKKIVTTNETKEVQNVELEDAKANSLNINMKQSPVMVTKTRELSIDGETKYRDIDHSAYYLFNGEKYEIKGDEYGYLITNSDSEINSYLRKTSNNNYLFVKDGQVSAAYFDSEGNLIIDTYNQQTDRITTEKFKVAK
jgi:hypothetical protein